MTRRQFTAMLVVFVVGVGVLAYGVGRRSRDNEARAVRAQEQADANKRRIESVLHEIHRKLTTEEVRRLVRTLEELTGTKDIGATRAAPSPSARPTSTPRRTLMPLPTPRHRTPAPQQSFGPHPSPSPGTLKPVLCALLGDDTMAQVGVDCHRDTFVFCDLTGFDCPAPPEEPRPPPAPATVP